MQLLSMKWWTKFFQGFFIFMLLTSSNHEMGNMVIVVNGELCPILDPFVSGFPCDLATCEGLCNAVGHIYGACLGDFFICTCFRNCQ